MEIVEHHINRSTWLTPPYYTDLVSIGTGAFGSVWFVASAWCGQMWSWNCNQHKSASCGDEIDVVDFIHDVHAYCACINPPKSLPVSLDLPQSSHNMHSSATDTRSGKQVAIKKLHSAFEVHEDVNCDSLYRSLNADSCSLDSHVCCRTR